MTEKIRWGILGALAALGVVVTFILLVANNSGGDDDDPSSGGTHEVTYEVVGTADQANVRVPRPGGETREASTAC